MFANAATSPCSEKKVFEPSTISIICMRRQPAQPSS
jgi:hypothetical protein